MKITDELVDHLARLSRLHFSQNEKINLRTRLGKDDFFR